MDTAPVRALKVSEYHCFQHHRFIPSRHHLGKGTKGSWISASPCHTQWVLLCGLNFSLYVIPTIIPSRCHTGRSTQGFWVSLFPPSYPVGTTPEISSHPAGTTPVSGLKVSGYHCLHTIPSGYRTSKWTKGFKVSLSSPSQIYTQQVSRGRLTQGFWFSVSLYHHTQWVS